MTDRMSELKEKVMNGTATLDDEYELDDLLFESRPEHFKTARPLFAATEEE